MSLRGAERTIQHDIPLDHLEYDYINKCNDVKEVEKILKVLRSGEEGSYPQLEECAEEKLRKLNPNSRILRKSEPLLKKEYLEKQKREELEEDFKNWSTEMSAKDQQLRSARGKHDSLPGVRGQKLNIDGKGDKGSRKSAAKPNKNTKPMPRSHREWDKVDIEAELAKVDSEASTTKPAVSKTKKSLDLPDTLDDENLTDEEKSERALKEKDKGNEAFTAGDYMEAILYYTRSLSLIQSVAARNNRAQAYIKLKKWEKAIEDCTLVLGQEKTNIKACMRRATAYQGNNELKKAKADLQYVMENDKNNKKAQQLLEEVNGGLLKQKEKGYNLKIEEGTIDDSEQTEMPRRFKKHEKREKRDTETETSRLFKKLSLLNEERANIEQRVAEEQRIVEEKRILLQEKEREVNNLKKNLNQITSGFQETVKIANHPQTLPIIEQSPLPDHINKLKIAGNEKFKQGQYSEAVDLYGQAIAKLEKEPGNHKKNLSTLLSNRAAGCTKLGDCEGCVQDCSRALQLDCSSIKALIRRSVAYETMEKYRKAYVEYQVVLKLLPQNDTALQGMQRCANMLKQIDGPQWRDKLPRSTTSARLPDDYDSYPSRSSISPTPSSHEEQFKKHKADGDNHVKQGRYAEAVKCYGDCIKNLPKRIEPYTNRALCYLKLNKPLDVLTDCNNALIIDSKAIKALYRRAQAYRMIGELQKCRNDLQDLILIQPTNKPAIEELKQVDILIHEQKPKIQKKRMNIEETDSSEEETENVCKQSPTRTTPTHCKNRHKVTCMKKMACTNPQINSPYDFLHHWNALRQSGFTQQHVAILRQIEPRLLPKYVTNMLDSSMLSILIQCVAELLKNDESNRAFGILEHLTKVSRFEMLKMFFTDNDKRDLIECFEHLQEAADCPVLIEDLKKLRLLYSI